MSRTIDQRVVEMQFDNERFEKNVGESISTLDKLKSALHFKGTEDNFSAVEMATNKLGKSFSALEKITTGAFMRMGNDIEQWAAKTLKAMSGIDNLREGFKKFSDITESTGTLLSQGFDRNDVERELERLNWFTDETSYNLTDMVSNISKFTAAGQNLEDSSDAMMGIALWAALSGQNAGTASRAMYQLAQAMGTFMKRQDWMSIQNANMDTVEFREKALEAAVAAGTLQKNAQGMYRSIAEGAKDTSWFSRDQFVESLTEGQWFTKDVMMTVFRDYSAAVNQVYDYVNEHQGVTASQAIEILELSGAIDEFGLKAFRAGQEARTWGAAVDSVKDALSTGWMSIFQYIFGNYEEATKFYTTLANDFYDIFVEPVNSLIDVFEGWYNQGGRSTFISGLIDMIETAQDFTASLGETFDRVFFLHDSGSKMDFTAGIDEAGMDRRMAKMLEYAQEAEDAVDLSDDEIIYNNKVTALMKLTNGFRKFVDVIVTANENSGGFQRALAGVAAVFDIVRNAIGSFFKAIGPLFGGLSTVVGWVLDILGGVGDKLVALNAAIKKGNWFGKFFKSLLKPLYNLKNAIKQFIDAFLPKFMERWANLKERLKGTEGQFKSLTDKIKGYWETLKTKWENLFTNFDANKLVDNLFKAWDKLKDLMYDLFGIEKGKFGEWFGEKLAKAEEDLDRFTSWAKEKFEWLWENTKYYFGLMTTWIETHWGDITSFLKGAFETIGGFFKGLWQGIKGFFGESDDGTSGFESMVETFKVLGETLGKIFGWLLKALKPLTDGIKNTLESMSFDNIGDFLLGGGILGIGIAFKNFASPFKAAGGFLDSLADVLNGFTNTLNADALKKAATAVAILVGSIFVLISMPEGKMYSSAIVLGTIIEILAQAMKKLSGFTRKTTWKKGDGLSLSGSSAGGVILSMAIGMFIIAGALRMIAKIPEQELYRAATVIGVLMYVLSLVAKSLSRNVHKVGKVGSGNAFIKAGMTGTFIALAIFLVALVSSIKKIADLQKDKSVDFDKAIWWVVGILAGFVILVGVMNKIQGNKVASGTWLTVLAIAGGIYITVRAMERIAQLTTGENKISSQTMGQLIGMLIVMLLGFAAIMAAMRNATFENGGKMALGIIIIAGVMAALAYGLAEFAKYTAGVDLEPALVTLGALILVMAVIVALLGRSKKIDSKKLLGLGASLAAIAVSIAIMAGALFILSKAVGGKGWGELLKIGGAFAAIVAAVAILGKLGYGDVGTGLEKLGKALMFVGISVAAAGIGLLAGAEAIKLFGDSTTDFKKAGENISTFITEIVDRTPEWLMHILSGIIESLGTIVAGLISGIIRAAIQVLEGLLGNEQLPELINKAITVLCDIIDIITSRVGDLVKSIGGLVLAILTELNKWVAANGSEITKQLHEALQNIWNIIVEFFSPLGEKIFGTSWGEEGGLKDKLLNDFVPWFEGTFLFWLAAKGLVAAAAFDPIILKIVLIIGLLTAALAILPEVLGVSGLLDKDRYNYSGTDEKAIKNRLRKYYQLHYEEETGDEMPDEGGGSRAWSARRDKWVAAQVEQAYAQGYDAGENSLFRQGELQTLDPPKMVAEANSYTNTSGQMAQDVERYLEEHGGKAPYAPGVDIEQNFSVTYGTAPKDVVENYRQTRSFFGVLTNGLTDAVTRAVGGG